MAITFAELLRMRPALRNALPTAIAAAIALVAVDQGSKYLVVEALNLRDVGEIYVFPGLTFRMTWNTGVNFGLLSSGSDFTRWLIAGGALLIAAGLLLSSLACRRMLSAIGLGVAAGGAIGNTIDRFNWGAVADFLNVSCCGINNPWSFNVADIAIFAGIGAALAMARSRARRARLIAGLTMPSHVATMGSRGRLTLLPLAGALALVACSSDSPEEIPRKSRLKAIMDIPQLRTELGLTQHPLTSHLIWQGDELGLPRFMIRLGQRLIMNDFSGKPFLHLIDLKEGKLLWSRGVLGEAPGEFTSVASVTFAEFASHVYVYDYNQRRVTLMPLDMSNTMRRDSVVTFMHRPLEIHAISDRQFLANSHDSSGTAGTILDSTFAPIATFGTKVDSTEDIPSSEYRGAYQASMCVSPSRNMFALAFMSSGRIEMYDLKSRMFHARGQAPFYFPPNIDVHPLTGRRVFNGPSPNRRTAYVSCAASNRHVFALFAGKLKKYHKYPSSSQTDEVHQFDWAGKLVGVIRLDHEAMLIAVDEESTRLYTTTLDPAPSVRVTVLGSGMVAPSGARQ